MEFLNSPSNWSFILWLVTVVATVHIHRASEARIGRHQTEGRKRQNVERFVSRPIEQVLPLISDALSALDRAIEPPNKSLSDVQVDQLMSLARQLDTVNHKLSQMSERNFPVWDADAAESVVLEISEITSVEGASLEAFKRCIVAIQNLRDELKVFDKECARLAG